MSDHRRAHPLPIVVTRFSVQGFHAPLPTPAWVERRFTLLRAITAPSVARITSRPLAWVLLVAPETRAQVEDLLGGLDLPGVDVHLAETRGFAPRTGEITPDREIHPGSSDFVTFSLDSDDALVPAAVPPVLASSVGDPDGTLVDLPIGYRLDLDSGLLEHVVHAPYRQGPFLALRHRSRRTMLDTGGVHTTAREGRNWWSLRQPAWIQVVHSGNISNKMGTSPLRLRLRKALRFRRADLLRDGQPVRARERQEILKATGIAIDGGTLAPR